MPELLPQLLKLAVLGDGAMGTACAILANQRGIPQVTLWSALQENGQLLQQHRENIYLLPGVKIPQAIELTTDAAVAIDHADLILIAIPTVYLRQTLTRIKSQLQALNADSERCQRIGNRHLLQAN